MENLKLLALNFPPGFRFYPTDEELIIHYLKNKVLCIKSPNVSIMADINLYKFNPWELPSKALFGESEWFFFSPRDRFYPNGSCPNRTVVSRYWKATGTDKPIISCEGAICIGVKKVLVFYTGRSPEGKKTDWMMYKYRLLDKDNCPSSKIVGSMRLDDWVLCRIRQKTNKSILSRVPNECNKSSDQLSEDFKDTIQNMDFNLKYFEPVPRRSSDVLDQEIESLFLQGASNGDFTLKTNFSPTTNEGKLSHFFRVSYDL